MKVYTPGCWDLLHYGHLNVLKAAKSLGDTLIVGVASDICILEEKGRLPIIPQEERVLMLQALRDVDFAAIYQELNFIPHLLAYAPDILAVGEQWGSAQRHKDAELWAAANGCSIVKLPYTKGVSTTEIIHRVRRRS